MNHLPCVSALGKRECPLDRDFPDQRANVDTVFAIITNSYVMVKVNKATPLKFFIIEDV